ncbi:AAA family ATPase [Candidatus Kirkpatrickella diaphorinae]|uniref:Chromosome partition protein Smc n=1 Tax=Candidatus Kirkpatrickella diaphorinae TaxID=2984322 RepID=A0ABY6GKH9_9PROT|nr:AAA family ATPase [Candidatus Kirkpatrickella diaphorinae]UYH52046.1 AAA family ATPase [Candidatus Kirkpatrickella diaphorinae]
MKASFTALRIAGFKSFADPVTVDLRPGLTAIVGPNGCGKSNIVEAFRWIMGESSARALRGGESDDLIFAGTVARPARNLVEVSLVIENARGLAAAPHHEEDTLEIIRTAKRGTGSDFRINGRAARAHDVTQIFADLSLGGRSLAIVSQNRIGALIDAKPIDRRSLLENAAGISGLHFRRRDAQLKLRQAEANLQRAEDATFQLMERRDALEAQSASALAYREAVETIRAVEAQLHAVQLARADAQIAGCAAATEAALAKIALFEKTLQQLTDRRQTEAEQTVKWEAESEATRNAIETLRLAIEKERQMMAQNESDQTRIHAAMTAAQEEKNRLQQRIDAMSAEARACHETIQNLAAQFTQLPEAIATCDADLKEAETLRDKAMRLREAQEQRFMQVRIKADALDRQRQEAEKSCATIEKELADCHRQREDERAVIPREADIKTIETRIIENDEATSAIQDALEVQKAALQQMRTQGETTARRLYALKQDIALRAAEHNRLITRRDALNAQLQKAEERQKQANAAVLTAAQQQSLESHLEEARKRVAALRVEEATLGQAWRDAGDSLAAQRLSHDTALQQRSFLQRQRESAESALQSLIRQVRDAFQKRAAHQAERIGEDRLQDAASQARAARKHRDMSQKNVTKLRQACAALQKNLRLAEEAVLQLESARIRHQAERSGLEGAAGDAPITGQLLDLLDVPPALAGALGAAFQSGLDAQLAAPQAQRSWEELPARDCGNFPEDVTPLSQCVDAPAALQAFLSATGLVPSTARGAALHATLKPGQALVSREGAFWRWDGYRQSGDLPTEAALRLQKKARYEALTALIKDVTAQYEVATRQRDDLRKSLTESTQRLDAAEADYSEAETKCKQCVDALTALENRQSQSEALYALLESQYATLKRQEQAAQAQFDQADEDLRQLADEEGIAARLLAAQQLYDEAVQRHETCWSALRAAVKAENQAQQNCEQSLTQHKAAAAQLEDLAQQIATLKAERTDLETRLQQTDTTSLRTEMQEVEEAQAQQLQKRDAIQADCSTSEARKAQLEQMKADLLTTLRTLQDHRLSRQGTLAALDERFVALEKRRILAEDVLRALPPPMDHAEEIAALDAAREAEQTLHIRLDRLREKKATLTAALQDAKSRQATESCRLALHETQIETYQSDLTRLASHDARLSEEQNLVTVARQKAEQSLSPLEANLTETCQHYETLRAQLDGSCDAYMSLGHDIRETETALREAQAAIERAAEKHLQASTMRDRLLDSPPPAPCKTAPEDISERAEQNLRRVLTQAVQKRDSLGAVNLLAEKEFREIEAQIADTQANIDEIKAAIDRLQTKIAHLNQEGRKRLRATFKDVDAQFQRLFSRIFGGGKANLALVGGDDPLEAGLEIYAQPPGKKLSTLSLLSGGEQALTALSLLFATFACEPAPICILDEVDAPLDEANTVRLCALVRDMTSQYGVQFMIVTHQQVTMAHMDRLYGVTMQERGVSRILSVDLSHAIEMAETVKSD